MKFRRCNIFQHLFRCCRLQVLLYHHLSQRRGSGLDSFQPVMLACSGFQMQTPGGWRRRRRGGSPAGVCPLQRHVEPLQGGGQRQGFCGHQPGDLDVAVSQRVRQQAPVAHQHAQQPCQRQLRAGKGIGWTAHKWILAEACQTVLSILHC